MQVTRFFVVNSVKMTVIYSVANYCFPFQLMRTIVVILFWLFVASVAVKAHRVDKRRGKRPSQLIVDSISMLTSVMEHAIGPSSTNQE